MVHKTFFHLLDASIMFREYQKQTYSIVKLHVMDFRLNLIWQLLGNHFIAKTNGRNCCVFNWRGDARPITSPRLAFYEASPTK